MNINLCRGCQELSFRRRTNELRHEVDEVELFCHLTWPRDVIGYLEGVENKEWEDKFEYAGQDAALIYLHSLMGIKPVSKNHAFNPPEKCPYILEHLLL